MINTAPPAWNSVYVRLKNGFQNICVTVVQWSRSCLHVQINRVRLLATLFSVCLYRFYFFFCLVLVFPFRLFFFILTAEPAGHALGSIYILSLSPEYYFGKGISKVLDLHTCQAYGHKKPQAVNLCPLSSQTAEFFSMLVDIMTNNTQYTTNCTSLHPKTTSDPLAKFKLAFCTSS